ncbi:MAG TPA: GNAT family N-acetyltransferase [Polyangia bacterium]
MALVLDRQRRPMERLRIITEPADWRDATARVHAPGVLASHEYLAAAATLETDGRAELAVWEDQGETLVHPYVRRPIPQAPGFSDITSAYEFGGLWTSSRDAAVNMRLARGFAEAFASYARKSGIVSEFVRVHPFTDGGLAAHAYEVRHAANHTVVDTARAQEGRAPYPTTLRQAIRKAERRGLRLEPADDFRPFVTLYHANLDRLGARPYYYFPHSFFERLRGTLALYHVVDPQGRLCAAHVYLRDGARLFAFLCHGVRERLDSRPNDFAYDRVIREAANQGIGIVHLGGGQPSLLRYKTKFSSWTLPFYIGTRIYDESTYRALVVRHEAALGAPVTSGFFPLYRAPRATPGRPERNRSNEGEGHGEGEDGDDGLNPALPRSNNPHDDGDDEGSAFQR